MWTWQSRWAGAFVAYSRVEVHRVMDAEGGLVAALPLYEASRGVFETIGGADVSDYLDLVAVAGREEEAWTALLQARGAEPVEGWLHAVPADSPTVTALPPLPRACRPAAEAGVHERRPRLALPPTSG